MSTTPRIYSRCNTNVMPSGRKFEAGRLYLADDDCGSVHHLYTESAIELNSSTVSDISTASPVSILSNPSIRVEGNAHPHATFVATPREFRFDYQLVEKVQDLDPLHPSELDTTKVFRVTNISQLGHMFSVPYDDEKVLIPLHKKGYPRVYLHDGEILFETRFEGHFYIQVDGGIYIAKIVQDSSRMIIKLDKFADADHLAGAGWTSRHTL